MSKLDSPAASIGVEDAMSTALTPSLPPRSSARPLPAAGRRIRLGDQAAVFAATVFDATAALGDAGVRTRLRNAAIAVYHGLVDGAGAVRSARALDALARVVAQLLIGARYGLVDAGEVERLVAMADALAGRIVAVRRAE